MAGLTKTEAYRVYGILKPKLLTAEKPKDDSKDDEKSNKPVKVEQPETKIVPAVIPPNEDDLQKDALDIPEDVIDIDVPEAKPEKPSEDIVPEAKPEGSSEDDEGQATDDGPASVDKSIAEVTALEMESFTHFVQEVGGLKRAKAIYETCVKSYAALYGD